MCPGLSEVELVRLGTSVFQDPGWESSLIYNLLPMASGLFAIPELGDHQGLCL